MPISEEQNILYSTRTEEVQEIIGAAPKWITRWGITVIGILVVGFFAGAKFIAYPDKLQARIIIRSSEPPIKVVCNATAQLEEVLVKPNDSVYTDQVLAVLANGAKYTDVKKLQEKLLQFITQGNANNLQLAGLQLGPLQNSVMQLQSSLSSYRTFINSNQATIKLAQIESQVRLNNQLLQQQGKRNQMSNAASTIEKLQFDTDQKLYEQGAITKSDFLESKKRYYATLQTPSTSIAEKLQKQQQQFELAQSKLSVLSDKETKLSELQQALSSGALQAFQAIAEWEKQFVVKAPVSGKIALSNQPAIHQVVQAGSALFNIVQSATSVKITGIAPLQNSGELKVGQKVNIDLVSYPSNKYGFVSTEINNIATASTDSVLYFECMVPSQLITSMGANIPIVAEQFGMASIITQELSLWDRIFNKLVWNK
jgi:hypothetical protein